MDLNSVILTWWEDENGRLHSGYTIKMIDSVIETGTDKVHNKQYFHQQLVPKISRIMTLRNYPAGMHYSNGRGSSYIKEV